jgi:hypothetical protein
VAAGYLTEADGELTQVRLGEADERAAGVGNPRRRGGCDTQGAREGGDADVLRRGRHFLLLFCDWDGCLLIHVLVSCCRMGRAHGLRWGLSSLCIWLKKWFIQLMEQNPILQNIDWFLKSVLSKTTNMERFSIHDLDGLKGLLLFGDETL